MKRYGNCDFSYAGLKTSVRLCIERELGSAEGAGKRATTLNSRGSNGGSSGGSNGSSGSTAEQPCQQQQQQQQHETDPHQQETDAQHQQQQQTDPPQQQQQQQEANIQQQETEPPQQQQQDARQQQIKADVAASFQRVAVAHLVMRLKRAIDWARAEEPSLQHLVVAGGVASNQYVRQQVSQVGGRVEKNLHAAAVAACRHPGKEKTSGVYLWLGFSRISQHVAMCILTLLSILQHTQKALWHLSCVTTYLLSGCRSGWHAVGVPAASVVH